MFTPLQEVILYRNFFAAEDGGAIAGALNAFAMQCEGAKEFDLLKEEFMFNKLFVGPEAPIAPPYASVWLDDEKLLMTKQTMDVRHFYAQLGLEAPQGMPDDFLALELEVYIVLQQLMSKVSSHEDRMLLERYLRWWVLEHWQQWLPLFTQTVLSVSDLTPGIKSLVLSFQRWLREQVVCLGMSESIASPS